MYDVAPQALPRVQDRDAHHMHRKAYHLRDIMRLARVHNMNRCDAHCESPALDRKSLSMMSWLTFIRELWITKWLTFIWVLWIPE